MNQALLLIHCIFNFYNNPIKWDLLFSPFTNEETEAQKPEMTFQVTQLVSGRGFEPRVYTILCNMPLKKEGHCRQETWHEGQQVVLV